MIKGNDNISRKPFLGSTEISQVWLGNILIYPDGVVPPTPGYENQYLTFEALEDGETFSFSRAGLDYSTDDGTTWTSLGQNVNTPSLLVGEKIMFKGRMVPDRDGIGKFSSNGRFNVEGNPMSLLFDTNFVGETSLEGYEAAFGDLFYQTDVVSAQNLSLPATTLETYCYFEMFYECANLVTPPVLPATTLKTHCYLRMFYGCTSLTSAPALPATTAPNSCYSGMFIGCTSLTSAPVLPATTVDGYSYAFMFQNCTSLVNVPSVLTATRLGTHCYRNMFEGCTSITSAPELPATTLAEGCYYEMFRGCTNLVNTPSVLPATTLASSCYRNMFSGCSNLVTAPALPATTLATDCYYEMFRGCSKLNYIKAMFTTNPKETSTNYYNYTSNWVSGVAANGTFVKNAAATWSDTGVSSVPTGWTIETATA